MAKLNASILDAEGLRLTKSEIAFFRDANPFGFILFARNVDTADQVSALCDEMRAAVGRDAPILIDQEGGRVQRLRPPLARNWLPPLEFVARAGANAPRAMYIRARLIAAELHALGIDTNCAPMLDLARPDTHAFLKNRCYGDTPFAVAELGRVTANGFLDSGVLPIMKHMPGHGLSQLDTHHDLPTVSASVEMLNDLDFAPFRDLNDLPMGMTAHIVFDQIAPEPATLSPEMISLIRSEIGFDGLLMTDDISMKALSGTASEITRRAISAGCDVVLYCNQPLTDRVRVSESAGDMSDAAIARAERALSFRQPPKPLDIAALDAELDALMGRGPGDD